MYNGKSALDEDGRTVGWTKWGEGMEREHGSPYYHIHVGVSGFP